MSVLITAYNREAYIAESIESVLAQTFTDFELIVVDDQSTDATVDIARRYEARDSRIRVVVNASNLGQFANRNRAAELATADLLKYHDSDDVMYPHCLQVLVEVMDRCPQAAVALTRSHAWQGSIAPSLSAPRQSYLRHFLGPGMFDTAGPAAAMFRTAAFRELGGFREDVGVPADYLFWMTTCARVTVALAPCDLFYYRCHPRQELRDSQAARQYATVKGEAWAALASSECPLTADERKQACRIHVLSLAREAWRDARRGDVAFAVFRLRHGGPSLSEWLRYFRPVHRDPSAGTDTTAVSLISPAESAR